MCEKLPTDSNLWYKHHDVAGVCRQTRVLEQTVIYSTYCQHGSVHTHKTHTRGFSAS